MKMDKDEGGRGKTKEGVEGGLYANFPRWATPRIQNSPGSEGHPKTI
jgi:hypothetical protein